MNSHFWRDNSWSDSQVAEADTRRKENKRQEAFVSWTTILGANTRVIPNRNRLDGYAEKRRVAGKVPLKMWMGDFPKLKSVDEENVSPTESMYVTPLLEPETGVAVGMAALSLDGTPVKNPILSKTMSRHLLPAENDTVYEMSEVETHCWKNDAWVVIDDVVYDATEFIQRHPGGPEKIIENAGTDITDRFYGTHKRMYLVRLKRLGVLASKADGTGDPTLVRVSTW